MYLSARKYVAKVDWEQTKKDPDSPYVITEDYKAIMALAPEGIDELAEVSGANVEFPIGYWRKANAIHGWIVDNCAGGEDNCQPIHIPLGKLMELSALVDEVLDSKNASLLPPAEGFFFGTYEIDEWYFSYLENTKAIMDKAKVLADSAQYDIYYQASW